MLVRGREMSATRVPLLVVVHVAEDATWRDDLVGQLRVLETQRRLAIWESLPGDASVEALQAAIERAAVALVLVSSDLLSDETVLRQVIPTLVSRRAMGGLRIVAVRVRPCATDLIDWLREVPVRPGDGRAMTLLPPAEREAALAALAIEIEELIRRRDGVEPEPEAGLEAVRLAAPPSAAPLPEFPYPLLEPYRHPETFTGRERELALVLADLARPGLILCVHASSGAGKSSFFQAGLVPSLRARGVPVSLHRRPDEPRLAARVFLDLVTLPAGMEARDDDLQGFVDLMERCRALAGRTPVVILDQFEDAVRRDDAGAPLARLGPLLAAVASRPLPHDGGFVCRFVLAYRHEYHGEVMQWLGNVQREARSAGHTGLDGLPMDLNRPDYLRERALSPLGEPGPVADVGAAAEKVFLAAIEKPLSLRDESGMLRFPYQFADGDALRLARAFARARIDRPRAPLTPELQVVLDHLVRSSVADEDGIHRIVVPEDPGALIQNALADHLRNKLTEAFRIDDPARAQRRRTLALFALRELADETGQRGKSVPVEQLESDLGEEGRLVLRRLEQSNVRLLIRDQDEQDFSPCFTLPHDRLAQVVVGIFQDEAARRLYGLDEALVELRRQVALLVQMDKAGHVGGTELPDALYDKIQAEKASLLVDEERRRWWERCETARARRRAARRRELRTIGVMTVASVALLVALGFMKSRDEKANRLEAKIRDAVSVEGAAVAYDELSLRLGEEKKARAALGDFLIRDARSRAFRGEYKQALLERLKASTLLNSEENLREASALARTMPVDFLTLRHDAKVEDGSVSDDGTHALTWTDSVAYLWDIRAENPNFVPLVHPHLDAGRIFEQGRIVVTWSAQEVRLWHIGRTTPLRISGEQIVRAIVSLDGARLLVIDKHGARVFECESGRQIGSIGDVVDAVFVPGESNVVVQQKTDVRLWWPERVGVTRALNLSGISVKRLCCFSQDQTTLIAVGAHEVLQWRRGSDALVATGLRLSPSGYGMPVDACLLDVKLVGDELALRQVLSGDERRFYIGSPVMFDADMSLLSSRVFMEGSRVSGVLLVRSGKSDVRLVQMRGVEGRAKCSVPRGEIVRSSSMGSSLDWVVVENKKTVSIDVTVWDSRRAVAVGRAISFDDGIWRERRRSLMSIVEGASASFLSLERARRQALDWLDRNGEGDNLFRLACGRRVSSFLDYRESPEYNRKAMLGMFDYCTRWDASYWEIAHQGLLVLPSAGGPRFGMVVDGHEVSDVAFPSDAQRGGSDRAGCHVLVVTRDGGGWLYSVEPWKKIGKLSVVVDDFSFSPDGEMLYVLTRYPRGQRIERYDTSSGRSIGAVVDIPGDFFTRNVRWLKNYGVVGWSDSAAQTG